MNFALSLGSELLVSVQLRPTPGCPNSCKIEYKHDFVMSSTSLNCLRHALCGALLHIERLANQALLPF
jgi:hypothetical protein